MAEDQAGQQKNTSHVARHGDTAGHGDDHETRQMRVVNEEHASLERQRGHVDHSAHSDHGELEDHSAHSAQNIHQARRANEAHEGHVGHAGHVGRAGHVVQQGRGEPEGPGEHGGHEAQGQPEGRGEPEGHGDHGGHEEHGDHEESGEHEGHEKGLRHLFRERAISLRTMERPLRLITGLALAELIVTAILLAARGLPLALPPIAVYVQDGHLFQLPLPVFVVSLVFLVVAWSYLLAGALHAHPLVRVAGLALFTWAMLDLRDVTLAAPYAAIESALLAAMWLVGLATWLIDRRAARLGAHHRDHHHRLRGLTFCAVLVLVAALYAVPWLSLRGLGALLFPQAVSAQLAGLQFVLIPVLFLAGTDFAEWGEAAGERLADLTGRVRPPLLPAVATVIVALAVLASIAVQLHHEAAHQLVLGLVVLAVVVGLLARLRDHGALPERVPYAALAGVAALYFAVMLAPSLPSLLGVSQNAALQRAKAQPTGALTTYQHATPLPRFSIAYPAQWRVDRLLDQGLKQPLLLQFNGISAGNAAAFYVLAASAAGERSLARMRAQWFALAFRGHPYVATPSTARGPWQSFAYVESVGHGSPIGGAIWQRRSGALDWLLMSQEPARFASLYNATFAAMVDSWRPALAPASSGEEGHAPAISDGDRLAANAGLFWLGVAVLAALALLFGRRRLRSGALAAGALFLTVAGTLFFLAFLPSIRLVYGATLRLLPAGQHLGIPGEQAAVALGSLAVVGWLAARRRLTPRTAGLIALLLGLNIALQIVAWIFDGYSHASDLSGRLSVAQAVIVLLALLWDVTMSGEEITNVHGHFFPRHTRVLLFFGYVVLVATMVLYFSSLQVQATGAAVEAQFETEMWPQSGLLGLGVPLLLSLFVLKVYRWLDEPEEDATTPEPESQAAGGSESEQMPTPLAPAAGLETAASTAG